MRRGEEEGREGGSGEWERDIQDQTAPSATPSNSLCVNPVNHFAFLSSLSFFLSFLPSPSFLPPIPTPFPPIPSLLPPSSRTPTPNGESEGGVDLLLFAIGASSSPFSRFSGINSLFSRGETGERIVLKALISALFNNPKKPPQNKV